MKKNYDKLHKADRGKSVEEDETSEQIKEDANHSEMFDLTILPLRDNDHKERTKRPIDPRLPDVDAGVNMLIVAPPRQGKTVTLVNLLGNSQFYKNYFDKNNEF